MRYLVVYGLCVGLALVLVGCGQKGDLYLPDNPPKADAKKAAAADPASTLPQ